MPPEISKLSKEELEAAKRALLARRMKGMVAEVQEVSQVKPRAAGVKTPMSMDQYRIWLHHSLHLESPTYNEPMTILHDGPLEPILLRKSIELYAKRHEAWRTTFQVCDDEVVQKVQDSVSVFVHFSDLRALGEHEREAEAQWLATVQASEPFDLTKAPLFRVRISRMSDTLDRVDLVVHHIVFDGTAIRDSFLPELATIYTALAAGKEPVLPAVELQYCDYSLWRAEQKVEESLKFWRETLKGDLPMAVLPLDRSRPAQATQHGAMERFEFSPELTKKLCETTTKHGGTLFNILLSTFQLLLFRYSGLNDVIVGTSANGRRQPELQGMMGCILDVFPVRVHPESEMTFAQFLRVGQASFLNSMDAADVPFEHIVKAIGIKRDASYHPIFQTFFSFLPSIANPPKGWDLMPKLIDNGSSKFDIYVEAEEREGGVAACVMYNNDIFDKSTIHRLIGHWITLAEGACAAPETTLGELPLLTPAERERMLVEWNQTASPLPLDKTFVDLFDAQVKRTPDKVAVQFEKRTLTFAELAERSERFAFVLREMGAGKGTIAGMCVNRSENMLALMIGILKSGATYLPLDPGTPLSRITLCLEDTTPAVLVIEPKLIDKVPTEGTNVLAMEDFVARAMALPEGSTVPRGEIDHDDIAYIIHTSGSTGRPKGVELPHRALLNVLLTLTHSPAMKAEDVMVAVTTVSFDISVSELLLPVTLGTKLVIASRAVAIDPFELSDLMDEVGCTVFQATPATWRALLAIEWEGRKGMLGQSGGEAMTRDLAEKLIERGIDIWNMYGPTEATIWATFYKVESRRSGNVPIGKPIENYTCYIVDKNLLPVPIGIPGELYIGGAGLARGYRNKPEMTAERFISLPTAGGERVYRTGDYAVYRADGTIECLGRADNQVKVRGYRIELEEVELHISAHPDVTGAAARVWEESTGSFRLSGYFVPREGVSLTGQDVRDFMKGRLPEYMIPSDLIALPSLPQTPNGKTDRKALPSPTDAPQERVPLTAAPETPQEQRLAKIWAEVLGVPSVNRTDNFFDLGGHSLLLVQMFARINREFNTQLPITTIFDAQTLQELAMVLNEDVDLSSLVPVQPEGSRRPLFVAHSYLLYRALSTALGNDQPLYGLRELETDGNMSISQRAQRYVQDMRSVQPRGPYQIAGWCAAGPLAVEIAQQVLRTGEEVSEVILFDAWLPGYAEGVAQSQGKMSFRMRLFERGAELWDRLKGLTLKQRFAHFQRIARRTLGDARDNFYVRNWSKVNEISKRLNVPLPQFMHNTTLQTFAALNEFCASPMPVHITLIRASETRRLRGTTESCGWEEVAERGVKVLWAPGDHETMFQGANLMVTANLVEATLADSAAVPAGADKPHAERTAAA